MNKQKKYYTDFLTANSFIIGMGSIYNLGGNYFIYNCSEDEDTADAFAIANDWNVVGQDINAAIGCFKNENKKQLELEFTE